MSRVLGEKFVIDEWTVEAIQQMVNHYYADEREHFDATAEEGDVGGQHIFFSIRKINEWLKNLE